MTYRITPWGIMTPAESRAADEALRQMFAYWEAGE